MEGGWTDNDFSIVCTQPRRIAASTLAARVAQEVGCRLGGKVGYTVRFDDQSSPQTQVKVRTLTLIYILGGSSQAGDCLSTPLFLFTSLVCHGWNLTERGDTARPAPFELFRHHS